MYGIKYLYINYRDAEKQTSRITSLITILTKEVKDIYPISFEISKKETEDTRS